jgi:hypothetical protein
MKRERLRLTSAELELCFGKTLTLESVSARNLGKFCGQLGI